MGCSASTIKNYFVLSPDAATTQSTKSTSANHSGGGDNARPVARQATETSVANTIPSIHDGAFEPSSPYQDDRFNDYYEPLRSPKEVLNYYEPLGRPSFANKPKSRPPLLRTNSQLPTIQENGVRIHPITPKEEKKETELQEISKEHQRYQNRQNAFARGHERTWRREEERKWKAENPGEVHPGWAERDRYMWEHNMKGQLVDPADLPTKPEHEPEPEEADSTRLSPKSVRNRYESAQWAPDDENMAISASKAANPVKASDDG